MPAKFVCFRLLSTFVSHLLLQLDGVWIGGSSLRLGNLKPKTTIFFVHRWHRLYFNEQKTCVCVCLCVYVCVCVSEPFLCLALWNQNELGSFVCLAHWEQSHSCVWLFGTKMNPGPFSCLALWNQKWTLCHSCVWPTGNKKLSHSCVWLFGSDHQVYIYLCNFHSPVRLNCVVFARPMHSTSTIR